MKLTLTCKFKLDISKDQKNLFLDIAKAYRDAVNYILEQNLEEKTTNVKKLHHLYYTTLRERFNLSAQIAINVNRDVSAMYKTLWVQFKELKRRKPDSKAVKKFWDKPPKRKSLKIHVQPNRKLQKDQRRVARFFVHTSRSNQMDPDERLVQTL